MTELCADDSQSTQNHPNYAILLPPCLANLSVELISTSIHTFHDGELGTQTLTYTVEWEDDIGSEQKFVELLEKAQKKVTLATLKSEVSTGSREQHVAPPTFSQKSSKNSKKSRKSSKNRKKKRHSKKCKWSTSKKAKASLHTESSEELTNSSMSENKSIDGCSSHRFDSEKTYYDNLSERNSKKSSKTSSKSSKSSKSSSSTQKSSKSSRSKSSSSSVSSLPSIFGEKELKKIASSTSSDSLQFSSDFSSLSSRSAGSVYDVAVSSMLEMEAFCVKMVLIETPDFEGTLIPIRVVRSIASSPIQGILIPLLADQYSDENPHVMLRKAAIYFAFRDADERQKLRRIRQTDIDKLTCAHLPRLDHNNICLVLDLAGVIAANKKVALDFDA